MCEIFQIMIENKIAVNDILADTWGILNMDCMLRYWKNIIIFRQDIGIVVEEYFLFRKCMLIYIYYLYLHIFINIECNKVVQKNMYI